MWFHFNSLFTNSNWFSFDNGIDHTPASTSLSDALDDVNLNSNGNSGDSSSDDDVVISEDKEPFESQAAVGEAGTSEPLFSSVTGGYQRNADDLEPSDDNASTSQFMTLNAEDLFSDRPVADWIGWRETQEMQLDGSSVNPFDDIDSTTTSVAPVRPDTISPPSKDTSLPNGLTDAIDSSESSPITESNQSATHVHSLFEDDVEFVGVELEGTEKAMEHALKEGIVGEAGALKRNINPSPEKEKPPADHGAEANEFNDANYWRMDQNVAVLE